MRPRHSGPRTAHEGGSRPDDMESFVQRIVATECLYLELYNVQSCQGCCASGSLGMVAVYAHRISLNMRATLREGGRPRNITGLSCNTKSSSKKPAHSHTVHYALVARPDELLARRWVWVAARHTQARRPYRRMRRAVITPVAASKEGVNTDTISGIETRMMNRSRRHQGS